MTIIRIIKNEWQSKKLLNRCTVVFSLLALITCCGGAVKIIKDKFTSPTLAKISLVYQSASKSENPNGTRFDPYEIVSEDVLKKASETLGYEIDSEKIWVSLPESGNSNQIATDYMVYCNDKNSTEILQAVIDAWSDVFKTTHTSNSDSTNYETPDESLDYIYLENWLETEASEIQTYAKTKLKADNTWTNDDGIGFQNIYDDITNLIDVDIKNFKTYIIQNGVSKDVDSLKSAIAYKDELLLNKQTNYQAQYDNRLDAINLYDPTLFPTISVPSISSGTYYITTTKTGLDYIYDAASIASTNATDIQKTISEDNQLISNMKKSGTDKTADDTYQTIVEKIKTLSERLQKLDEEYKNEEEEPYFRVVINGETYTPHQSQQPTT